MSIASALNDICGVQNSTINTISDIIGAISDASGGLGAVISVVTALLNAGKPDEVQEALADILNRLQVDFQQLNQDLSAQQILNRNTTLNGYVAPALTQLQLLQAEINAQPSQTEIIAFIEPCVTALNDLSGSTQPDLVWNMDFDWQIYWTDAGTFESVCHYPLVGGGYNETPSDVGYKEQAPSPNPDGTVFVYTYSLPLYLFATSILLAVAGSLDANFTTDYADVLGGAATLLKSKHDQIVQNGITLLTPPSWAEAGLVGVSCPPPVEGAPPPSSGVTIVYSGSGTLPPPAVAATIEYGSVEKFSGASSVGSSYQIDFGGNINFDNPVPFNKLQLRVLKRAKDVYNLVGLRRVWQVINQLNGLVGQPAIPSATITWQDGSIVDLTDWSFRQIFGLAKLAPTANGYSLRALGAFIIGTQPFDTPYSPGATSFSFINLLTNFSD